MISNKFNIGVSKQNSERIIQEDLNKIQEDYPNQIFIVGNKPDDYALLARLYWGDSIKEFVSIQDYNLFLENKTTLFEKKFKPRSNIRSRRLIWIAGGMDENLEDGSFYERINYAISIDEPLNLKGFVLEKDYSSLTVYKKELI